MGSYGESIGGGALSGATAGTALLPGIGTAAGALIGGLSGFFSHKKAQDALDRLAQTKYPQFSLIPQLSRASQRAEEMAQRGFTGAETGAFNQSLAQQGNMALRNGIDIGGGGQARALNAGINAMKLNSLNQFAGQDAVLHRSNIKYSDTLSQALQAQQNLQTQVELQRRNALEQSYGMAAQNQKSNVIGSLQALGSIYDKEVNNG